MASRMIDRTSRWSRSALSNKSFTVETTLSGRGYAGAVPRWRAAGYSVTLIFAEATSALSLPDVDTAVARVAERAQRDEALRTTNDALRQTLRHVRQMQSQIVAQEKLAGLGRLLAGVAHELRNPLGLAVNAIEAAADEADALARALPNVSGGAAEHLGSLRGFTAQSFRNGRRADDVVRSMYDHARAAIAQVPAHGVDVEVDLGDVVEVYGSGSALTRMLANIVENAVYAAQQGGARSDRRGGRRAGAGV